MFRLPRCACAVLCIGAALGLQACSRDEREASDTGINVVSGPGRSDDARTPMVTRADGSIALAEKRYEQELRYVIPREAAAIGPLRELLVADAEAKKEKAVFGFRESFAELPAGVSAVPWAHAQEWRTTAETEQLLVLVSDGYASRGAGRRDTLVEALIWDKRAGRRIRLGEMFSNEERALAMIREPFCIAFRVERRDRGAGGTECPAFADATIAPSRVDGGRFASLGVWVPSRRPGERTYAVELPIPERMAALVDPRWRASFPG